MAVEGGDGDLVERVEGVAGTAADGGLVTQLQLIVGPGPAPFARVRSGGERRSRAGQHHHASIEVFVQLRADELELRVHLNVDRVAFLRTVEPHRHHGAFALN